MKIHASVTKTINILGQQAKLRHKEHQSTLYLKSIPKVRKNMQKMAKYLGSKLTLDERRHLWRELIENSDVAGLDEFRRMRQLKIWYEVSHLQYEMKSKSFRIEVKIY